MPHGMEVGLSPANFVLDGDPAPTPKGAEPHTIFGPRPLWPNGCMDQDATSYGGRHRPTRYCVRCGPSYPGKRAHPPHPIFGPCLLWPNGWMDEDAAWYSSRPRPRPHCTRRGPSSRERGTAAPPLFGPYLLWLRSPTSATAELLFIKFALKSESGKAQEGRFLFYKAKSSCLSRGGATLYNQVDASEDNRHVQNNTRAKYCANWCSYFKIWAIKCSGLG